MQKVISDNITITSIKENSDLLIVDFEYSNSYKAEGTFRAEDMHLLSLDSEDMDDDTFTEFDGELYAMQEKLNEVLEEFYVEKV